MVPCYKQVDDPTTSLTLVAQNEFRHSIKEILSSVNVINFDLPHCNYLSYLVLFYRSK